MLRRAALPLITLAVASACHRPVALPPATITDVEPVAASPAVVVEAPAATTTSCPSPDPSHGERLIPEAAQWLVHLDVGAALASPLWPTIQADLGSELSPTFDALAACGLDSAAIVDVWVGFEPESEQFNAVIHGPGLGTPDRAMCLLRELDTRIDDGTTETLELVPLGDISVVPLSDGGAYLTHPDQLVLSRREWQGMTEALIACEGRSAVDAGLVPFFDAVVGAQADLVLAGVLAPELAAMLGMVGVPVEGAVDLAVMLDFMSGVDFGVRLGFATAELASSIEGSVRVMIDGVRNDPTAALFFNDLSLHAVDRELQIRGHLSEAAIQTLLSQP